MSVKSVFKRAGSLGLGVAGLTSMALSSTASGYIIRNNWDGSSYNEISTFERGKQCVPIRINFCDERGRCLEESDEVLYEILKSGSLEKFLDDYNKKLNTCGIDDFQFWKDREEKARKEEMEKRKEYEKKNAFGNQIKDAFSNMISRYMDLIDSIASFLYRTYTDRPLAKSAVARVQVDDPLLLKKSV